MAALRKAVAILRAWPEVRWARAYVQSGNSEMMPLTEAPQNAPNPRLQKQEQEIALAAWLQGPLWLETGRGWLHAFPRSWTLGSPLVVLIYLEKVGPWQAHLIATICWFCFAGISLCALRKRLEEKEEESRQVASERQALGRSAATGFVAWSVMHSLGNVLTALKGRLYLLSKEAGAQPTRNLIRRMEADLERAERLLRTELSCIWKQPKPPAALRVQALLDKAIGLARLGSDFTNIAISRQIEPAAGDVVCREEEICAALQQLLTNAAEAMPSGGNIHIVAEREGEFVHIKVIDTGHGVDESCRDSIFRPFFSTKGGGRGLGLAIAREIIRSNEGEILFESAHGKGAAFTIRLPSKTSTSRDLAGTIPRSPPGDEVPLDI